MSDTIADHHMTRNLEMVLDDIAVLEKRNGLDPGTVTLIAVSKRHPSSSIQVLYDHGHRDFGENYIQEALGKVEVLPKDIRWHFIGSLQSNKARHIPGVFSCFHCLGSIKLAQTLQNKSECYAQQTPGGHEFTQSVLLQVNIGREDRKSGVLPEDVDLLVESVAGCSRLALKGLMCIPPACQEPEQVRPYFAGLRQLRDDLEKRFGIRLPQLSMGMSGDYVQAISEGSTMIRVGTSLFGQRPS